MTTTDSHRLARTVSRLETLFQLALDQPDGKALRGQALEFAVQLTDSHGGYLHFFDDETQTIDLEVWSQEVTEYCELEKSQHYPLSSAGIWADCVRIKGPVIHNDYPSIPDEAKGGLPEGHFALHRHLAVPVIEHGKVVAIGGVANKEEPYTDEDVDALQLFMNSMWSVLQQGTAQAAVREAMTHRERFERLLDTVPLGVIELEVTDTLLELDTLPVPPGGTAAWLASRPDEVRRLLATANLRSVNRPMRTLMQDGLVPDEHGTFDPEHLGGLPEFFENLRIGPDASWPIRHTRPGPDGEDVPIDLYGSFRSIGRQTAVTVVTVDQSEAVRQQVALANAVASRDELVASVSHELRTPLTVVQGLLQATDELDGDEMHELLDDVRSHANELGYLIDDLLLLARMRAGDVVLEIGRVRASEVVSRVVEDGQRTGSIGFVAVEGDITLRADRRRLVQIVRNLLTNATRYGGPHVRVELGEEGDMGFIRVLDDGPGLTDLSEEAAFRAFETTRTISLPQSIGVGLPVSRLLVEAMAGTLTYSRRNDWTCFTATLPLP